jgi:translation initiation factor 2 alpha subunit (eIF-2alpha)
MELAVGDLVLCVVDKIIGTTVFVNIESHGEKIEGTIITSEIAPGRIRNLRDYVVPKKKIVCKILRMSENRIDLSLRRVTQKEKKEVLERHNLETSYERLMKNILGNEYVSAIEKINKKDNIYDFLENSKENPQELQKIVGIPNANKIISIIEEQKKKKIEIKKEINITTTRSDGLEIIKNLFRESGDIEIKYLSPGKYSLKKTSDDFKKANQDIKRYIEELEKYAKENNINFIIKDK